MVQQEREQAGREKKLADKHAELSTSRREGAESASKRSKQAATAWTPTRQEDCVAATLLESTQDAVARMWYAESIPFSSVYHSWIVDAFDMVCAYGAKTGCETFHLPSIYSLRNKMLDKEVARVEQELRNYEKAISEFGVAVTSDGKDAVNRKHLVNILSSNPNGSRFHKTIDVSGCTRDAKHTAETLITAAREIAAINDRHVVSVVTDTPSVNRAAWKLAEKELSRTFCTPCGAHCMNLHMKRSVSKLPEIRNLIEQCKILVKRFSNVDFARDQDLVRASCRAYTTDGKS